MSGTLGADSADFAGNKACAGCHAAIYRSYMRTPMAQSSGKVGSEGPQLKETFDRAEFRDTRGAFTYSVTPDYRFEFNQPGASQPIAGIRALAYFIGSGAAARTFLMDQDGFLFESPVTYYRQSASWKASPGFEALDYPYLTRPVVPGCLQCHASGIQANAGTLNGYRTPPFLENGVACERCHGAGSDHIAKGSKLLNPAKLAPAARDSICAQCHLSGEVRVVKAGKEDKALTPGGLLTDDLTVFIRAGSPSDLRVTSHVENLAQSACKRASGDKMWCGTCHDPHTAPEPAEKAAYFRSKCLTCHQTRDCHESTADRQANGDNCIACHMPRGPASDIQHVVFTDHSIRRKPSASGVTPASNSALEPYPSYAATTRDLALAYAVVALRDHNTADRERAFPLLKQAAAQGTADAQALAYLAEFYRDGKDDADALPIYQQVWRMDKSQYAAAAALGAYQMQRGNLAEAIQLWREALALNPAMVLVRVNLAKALLRMGNPGEAKAALEQALQFNPASPDARALLNQLPESDR
ncbi:MAG TPA: tetratricopeptide repeat protein [Bryobacteraceae bacterium]|nr:tetratricopeptide repeat protein [Bryobacteraceae bacterium]